MLEFNPRSTLPSKLIKSARGINNPPQQKKQKSSIDLSFNMTNQIESNSNTFFVRVSMSNLQDQKRIYKWRMNCSENFIGVNNIKLQSEGNFYNPNSLFKVQLEISKSNLPQIKDVCLSKCLVMLKSSLNCIKILLQYFDPVIFTEKMIFINKNGEAKVWMDQRFYINPYNQLYSQKNKQITQQQSLQSIISIFEMKCLKTKLSSKLFTILKNIYSIEGALKSIEKFQLQQNLFLIQGLKNSLSTTLNTSCSLEFSGSKNLKIRKQKELNIQTNKLNSMAKYYNQAKSQQLKPHKSSIINKKGEQQMIYKSQQQMSQTNSDNQNYLKENGNLLLTNPQKNQKRTSSSLVISQIFENNKLQIQNKKLNPSHFNYQFQTEVEDSPSKKQASQNQMIASDCITKFQQKQVGQYDEKQQAIKQMILQKNGWSNNFCSLFDKKNVKAIKQSFSQGVQQNTELRDFKLKHLHTMGREMTRSILPVDQQQFDQNQC